MTPYWERDGITVYLADCRDVLPTLGAVDRVITDPPYGTGRHRDDRQRGVSAPLHGTHVYDAWDVFGVDWLKLVEGVHSVAAFSSHLNLARVLGALGPQAKVVYWRKSNPMPICPATEPCAVRGLSVPAGSEWYGYNPPTKHHPTEKPLRLMEWLVSFTDPGELILDPFAGSMTTLVAAKRLGRRAIGIEREEKWCEAGVRRIERAQFGVQDALGLEWGPRR